MILREDDMQGSDIYDNERVYKMAFSSVYPLLVQKAERKGRTKSEVDAVICWLTGYDDSACKLKLRRILITKPSLAKPRR